MELDRVGVAEFVEALERGRLGPVALKSRPVVEPATPVCGPPARTTTPAPAGEEPDTEEAVDDISGDDGDSRDVDAV